MDPAPKNNAMKENNLREALELELIFRLRKSVAIRSTSAIYIKIPADIQSKIPSTIKDRGLSAL